MAVDSRLDIFRCLCYPGIDVRLAKKIIFQTNNVSRFIGAIKTTKSQLPCTAVNVR